MYRNRTMTSDPHPATCTKPFPHESKNENGNLKLEIARRKLD